MQTAILGPLEVRVDGRLISLGGPKQRALLAMLVLHANEVVSRDRLIDALWGERPPPSVQQSLDTYVSRLRRALGGDRLQRRLGGYLLRLEPGELDVDRFESLVRSARDTAAAGEAEEAERMFRDALALWRGPALADVLYEPFATPEAERLEEQRLAALEEQIDARLATGESAELVPELERLAREHPLRERVLGQLMLALYRSGRQADALAALRAARQRLADELGLEPGPQLQELQRRILQHDPSLDTPRRERLWIRKRRLSRPVAAVAVLALVAGAAAAIVLATGESKGSGGPGEASNRLLEIGARTGKLAGAVEVARPPSAVASGEGSIWVVDSSGETVTRVDPSSGAVVDQIPIGGELGSIVNGGGAIWVASTLGGTIKRIDPTTGTVTLTSRLGGASAAAIAFGGGGLWVADATDHAVVEIDPMTGEVGPRRPLDLRPSAVAVAGRAIWVAGYDRGTVEEIDPGSGQTIATVSVGHGPSALALEDSALWVANSLDATVSRINANTGSVVATIPVGSGPSAITTAAGSVWVANTYAGTVSRIDPRRNKVVSTLRVGGRPATVAATAADVWVGAASRGDTHRGGTLALVTPAPFPSIDPAFQDSSALATRLAYDTLVTFEAAAGPAGLQLVPDLALAVPTPSRGGTAYAFRLRPGIRYSNGRPLRAGDFRRAIERLFRVDSPGASYYSSVVGAAFCTQHPARCDLSRGIVTDDAARTVVFHLRVPDPDFLLKLTVLGFSAPVPPGTPDRDVGTRGFPGTGPYRVASSNERELRFVRNDLFREWSHAAQPDGNPDAIVWRFGLSPKAEVRAIERGGADWSPALIPPAQLRKLQIRAAAQLHDKPTFDVQFISLNTHRPPFDDVRVRRALNYAIDRKEIAHMYGSAGATPICQPLAPGLPGYRRYCPYTLHPRRDGRWTAPDLSRARRLVAASGTRGERVDVWAATDLAGVARQLPAYVAHVLRSLGYRTRLHLIPYATFSPTLRRSIQLSVDGDWIPDYPAPSSYIPAFFSCQGGSNRKHYFCDSQLDRQMQRASALELQDSAQAATQWDKVDHELVDRAIWVPTVNVRELEFVSKRLRNYQYHPVWGFMAGQIWLR